MPLWVVGVAILVALVLAWVFSGAARVLLRRRARLRWSTAIVLSIIGIVAGLLLGELVAPDPHLSSPLAFLLPMGVSILFIAVYAAVAAHLQKPARATIDEMLVAGESGTVEFKSTARVNLRTGQKDERMEHVVAKTVAAFLNADGGVLLIGVDDHGTPLGLDADLATLKTPDVDRFELWLRDLIMTTLGTSAAALVEVDFAEIGNEPVRTVCRVQMVASPSPVYLRPGRNAPPELWVRAGNSTRQLTVDDAAAYIMQRWPLGLGASAAAQVRAAVRFSGSR
ncbi:helix-turn-helix domain-containing protein [Microbacterium sp. SLBN-146]|uniref:AlbA family DNA-binding domain-containing protein n=1 Tax=Microbacterium sp. SLBN-146 TaxID=2768457 RepID=UPI0021B24F43|nr:ATP-binding protein [Microbacterium sp. SLBN-146]